MSEPTFAKTPYYSNEQLDKLSKDCRTMPVDGDGRSYEPEYNSMIVRSDILKLISDVRHSRRNQYMAEEMLATIIRNYHHVLPYDLVQGVVNFIGEDGAI